MLHAMPASRRPLRVLHTADIHLDSDRHDLAAGAGHVHVIRRLDGESVELPELDAVVWGRVMEQLEWGEAEAEGTVLRVDLSPDGGVRVEPRPLG